MSVWTAIAALVFAALALLLLAGFLVVIAHGQASTRRVGPEGEPQ